MNTNLSSPLTFISKNMKHTVVSTVSKDYEHQDLYSNYLLHKQTALDITSRTTFFKSYI